MKRYTSRSNISINVVLPTSKKNLHVAFSGTTDGGSMFYTDDKEVQKALESHYKYGKLFKEDKTFNDAPEPTETKQPEPAEDAAAADDNVKTISVSDIEEAKNYLSERFGISRTKLRSEKAIKEAAAENGIEFVMD